VIPANLKLVRALPADTGWMGSRESLTHRVEREYLAGWAMPTLSRDAARLVAGVRWMTFRWRTLCLGMGGLDKIETTNLSGVLLECEQGMEIIAHPAKYSRKWLDRPETRC
jgi:hypothetical protein